MNRRMIERSLRLVLLFFLTISLSMVLLQWIFPMLILSGSAATTMLLVIYLYLQNKNIILDDLTGLQNRKAFSKILEYYVRQKAVMDIILISLDDFKAVNDRFGQWNGDIFLKTISQYLKDIIPIKFIYRFSGDEFIIILDESIPVNAADLVDTIRKRFDDTWECGTFRCMQKTSIAIVRVPFHADTVEKIITLLEYCIDLSKKNGKGKTIFSDKETIKKMTRKIKIIDLMKKGLTQDIFEVYYQPVYSVKKNRFTTAEALLRLSDSELGAVSPVEFIPIAEETGIIADIGLQVLDKVCHFVKELENREVAIDAISINLSTVQLNSEDFVSGFLGIIDRNMVSPGKLRMEITESVFNNKFECVVDIMKIFNDHGIRFYLDDFGAGYSNIANIVDLPFEFIKIDSSILHKSVGSKKCLDVLNGLSRTFSEAGIKVLVEGVETPEHDEIARQIHADYIQGFLYAYPMPADDFIQYMKKSNP
jgi:diguanylate cyclase (GGDEF)-like protein